MHLYMDMSSENSHRRYHTTSLPLVLTTKARLECVVIAPLWTTTRDIDTSILLRHRINPYPSHIQTPLIDLLLFIPLAPVLQRRHDSQCVNVGYNSIHIRSLPTLALQNVLERDVTCDRDLARAHIAVV